MSVVAVVEVDLDGLAILLRRLGLALRHSHQLEARAARLVLVAVVVLTAPRQQGAGQGHTRQGGGHTLDLHASFSFYRTQEGACRSVFLSSFGQLRRSHIMWFTYRTTAATSTARENQMSAWIVHHPIRIS